MRLFSISCVMFGLAVVPGCCSTSDARTDSTKTDVSNDVGNSTVGTTGGGSAANPTNAAATTAPINLDDGVWTIAPTGDGWELTDSFTAGGTAGYTYYYSGSSGSGSMLVTNGPTDTYYVKEFAATPVTVAGVAAQRYSGTGIYWITLDGVEDLEANIETDDEGVLSEMEASLTVIPFDGVIEDDGSPESTALGGE